MVGFKSTILLFGRIYFFVCVFSLFLTSGIFLVFNVRSFISSWLYSFLFLAIALGFTLHIFSLLQASFKAYTISAVMQEPYSDVFALPPPFLLCPEGDNKPSNTI